MDKPSGVSETLYAAATESLVSDASATSTFEKMIQVAFTHSSVETFTKEIRDTERTIKKDFEVSSMPGPWRSAKSVIHSAMNLGISLVDDNGSYIGKTALQTKIKQAKPVKTDISINDYVGQLFDKMLNVPEGLNAEAVCREVKSRLSHIGY
jgi:hypothetical protein